MNFSQKSQSQNPDYKLGVNQLFKIKKVSLDNYEQAAYWAARGGIVILAFASMAFSWSYFAGWFDTTIISSAIKTGLAMLATVLLSVLITHFMNWTVASVLHGIFNFVVAITAILTALLLWFDIYGNIVGSQDLADAVIASREKGRFRYTEQAELDRLRREVHTIDSTHTGYNHSAGRNQTWVSGKARQTKDQLNKSIAYHEARKLAEQQEADAKYDSDVEHAKLRKAGTKVGLYWFNIGMYVIQLMLMILRHSIEIRRSHAPAPAPAPSGGNGSGSLPSGYTVAANGALLDQYGNEVTLQGNGQLPQNLYSRGTQIGFRQQHQQQPAAAPQPVATALQHVATGLQQPADEPEPVEVQTVESFKQAYSPLDLQSLKDARSGVNRIIPTYKKRAEVRPDSDNVAKYNILLNRKEALELLIAERKG